MENEEILANEAMEVTEETIIHDSTKTLKTLGIIGGALLVGGLAYKYAIKPMIQKHKDSRLWIAEQNSDENSIDAKEDDSEEE